MRIAFDGTALQPHRTGVGYYTEHLLQHLAEEATSEEIVVVSNQRSDTAKPLSSRVQRHEAASALPRQVWTQVIAPRALRELDADVAHFTNGMMPVTSRVPTVVTIHDMSLTLYPRYHPARRLLLNRPLMSFAARHAAAIITVSESAKPRRRRSVRCGTIRSWPASAAATSWPIGSSSTSARSSRGRICRA
jgi:glycosyltransferase involved in cell wall biosynthesis